MRAIMGAVELHNGDARVQRGAKTAEPARLGGWIYAEDWREYCPPVREDSIYFLTLL
jgi:hypothetical protein